MIDATKLKDLKKNKQKLIGNIFTGKIYSSSIAVLATGNGVNAIATDNNDFL